MSKDSPTANKAERRSRHNLERFGLLGAWLAVVVVFGLLIPNLFLTWSNLSTMLGSQSVLVIVALGLTVSLTAGEFDLSIANVLVAASMTTALLNVNLGLPIEVAVLAAVLLGLLVGWLNGFLTLRFNLNSLIVTLGVGTFLQGMVHWASKSTTISGLAPELVQGVIIGRIAGIPLAFYYALLLCLVLWYVFQYTALGRHFLFVGRNREVAKLSGIDVNRVRWLGMIVSSLFGALAGIIYTGTRGAADPTSGLSFMLPAFAAAFLGATAIYPGRFNPVGTIVSVYFLVTGITGLLLMGVAPFVQDLFYGGALIVAVTLSQALKRA